MPTTTTRQVSADHLTAWPAAVVAAVLLVWLRNAWLDQAAALWPLALAAVAGSAVALVLSVRRRSLVTVGVSAAALAVSLLAGYTVLDSIIAMSTM